MSYKSPTKITQITEFHDLRQSYEDLEEKYKILLNEKNNAEAILQQTTQEGIEKESDLHLELTKLKKDHDLSSLECSNNESHYAALSQIHDENQKELLFLRNRLKSLESEKQTLQKEHVQAEISKDQIIRDKDIKLAEFKRGFLELEKRVGLIRERYDDEKNKRCSLEEELGGTNQELIKLQSLTLSEKKALDSHLKKKELEAYRSGKVLLEYTEALNFKDSKENELMHKLGSVEREALEYREQMRKALKDKELYESIAEQKRKETETHKKLRETQVNQSLGLLKDKKALEGKLLEKRLEANRVINDLHIIKESQEGLLEEKINKDKELEALQEHAGVLLGQNKALNYELEDVVLVDEQIKKDLERKRRIESIKEKNDFELQRSEDKLSQLSPSKSLYKSPLHK